MDVVESAVVVTGAGGSEPASRTVESQPMAKVSLSHRLEYAALLAAVALARLAPVRAVTATGAGLAWLIGPWLRQNRRALVNLAIAFPQKSDAERRAIARAMWANMGRIFAETLVLERIISAPGRIELVAPERWQQRFTEPGPSIGCTLHLGNWELAIWPYRVFERRPTGVYKPLDNPLADRWLARTRRVLYPGGLLGKGESEDEARVGQTTARQLINIARNGGSIGFVSDHFDRRGEPIPFLGSEARFTTAPAMIARHVGARYWVGRCVRIGKGSRFRVELRELPVPRTSDKVGDSRALTAATFAVFEEWIRETPEQWMWWNTRWVDRQKPKRARRS